MGLLTIYEVKNVSHSGILSLNLKVKALLEAGLGPVPAPT